MIQGRFELPITLSRFYVLKLFVLLLLTCELTVLYLILLEMYKIFLHCFLLECVNAITIYFTLVKKCLNTTKINLEDLTDIQCHEHGASIDRVINTIIESIVFKR